MNDPIYLCFDIGGTHTRSALFQKGELVSTVIKTDSPRGNSQSLLQLVAELSREWRVRAGKRGKIAARVLGVPGPTEGNTLLSSPPLKLSRPLNFDQELKDDTGTGIGTGIPTFVVNDLNLAVRGELHRGLGKEFSNFCLLTISTGIGVGIVYEGRTWNRSSEVGHSIFDLSEGASECVGHRGCWASMAAGMGVENLIAKNDWKCTVEEFFNSPCYQDPIDEIKMRNAQGIGNIINAYNPEAIAVMGSIGLNQFEKIIPSERMLGDFSLLRPLPPLRPTTLGDEIGLWGGYYFLNERGIK